MDNDRAEANVAFEVAIKQGRLSTNPDSPNFAGRFMYMGRADKGDLFKDINTRQYLPMEG